MRASVLVVFVIVLAGCDAGGVPADTRDASSSCTRDDDCDDGLFCTGVETCALGRCTESEPCREAQTCDEAADRCLTQCSVATDADGDSHAAAECGGDDCADEDSTRFPGNVEVCDAVGHDEDCDASTIGDRDADDDGSIDASCCNTDGAGALLCGEDCDDADRTQSPSSPEVCDLVDNDCDAAVDEGVLVDYYPDADGDLFGDSDGEGVATCAPGPGLVSNARDCDDGDAAISPTAARACDGVDNACDGALDPGCPESVSLDAAATTSTATVGTTTGTAFRAACAPGSVVVGVDVFLTACGFDLDPYAAAIEVRCAPIALDADMAFPPYEYAISFGAQTVLGPHGCDSPGTRVMGRCEGGAVTRLSGRRQPVGGGTCFGPIDVSCSTLDVRGAGDSWALVRAAPTVVASSGGWWTTTPFDLSCPEGTVVTAISGREPSSLDGLTLECTPLVFVVQPPAP